MYRSEFTRIGGAQTEDPDIVYYNASIINDNQLYGQQFNRDPVVRFSETRSVPILKDLSDFYFSIVRFTMNGPNKDLPLFIPNIQIGLTQTDINLTSYSVGLALQKKVVIGGSNYTFNGYAQRFIQYQSESLPAYTATGTPLPNAPALEQDLRGTYYYVYTYEHWLDLVNEALALAHTNTGGATTYAPFASLQEQFQTFFNNNGGVGAAPAIITEPPKIRWNPSTERFSIYSDTYGFGGADALSFGNGFAANEEAMSLWFNTNMYGLFSNFQNDYLGDETNGQANQIIIKNKGGLNIYFEPQPAPTATPPTYNAAKSYWVTEQDYGSVSSLWSPIESIVFTSTLLPIFPEQVGAPIRYGSGNDIVSQNSSAAFQPIITDIALATNSPADYRQFLEYIPTAEYRMSDFAVGRQELRNIDVQVFWKARLNGQLYPIRMFNGSSVSIKMMFRKRGIGI